MRSRANTRTQLIKAGRRLFFAQDFDAISVDQVARDAGFTRATFYLHFSGREELIAAIMLSEGARPEAVFRWFETRPRDRVSVEGFVRSLGDTQRRFWTKPFHVAALKSSVAGEAFRTNRTRLMAVLAESFPAFAPVPGEGAGEIRRVARATNAIVLLEQLSTREAEMLEADLVQAMYADLVDMVMRLDADYPA